MNKIQQTRRTLTSKTDKGKDENLKADTSKSLKVTSI